MQPAKLIFWGAGATAELGMPTTQQQADFVRNLVGSPPDTKSLKERVGYALGEAFDSSVTIRWRDPLYQLIAILGDTDGSSTRIDCVEEDAIEAMRANWRKEPGNKDELRRRIIGLRLIYDWPGLKSVVQICPASGSDRFKLNDLLNILDMHINFGVRAPVESEPDQSDVRSQDLFLEARRLGSARNALKLLLMALFHIAYQVSLSTKQTVLATYRDFAIQIGRRAQRQAIALASEGYDLDVPEFYQGDVGFVSLNYDPIGLWIQFMANRELNESPSVPHIGSPAEPLHLYHDFGHLIPARGIERENARFPWYPLNEAAAQRLNEQKYASGYRVRLTKFLFPHGCLCWRECPDCGKLSAYHGHSWDLFADGLFPPPPLRAFDESACPSQIVKEERERREFGMVDARACLHCETITQAYHTQIVMQSSFKAQLPSFLEEIQRELRATTMRAEHIILMGYSLPLDDVIYRAFFSARRRRQDADGRHKQVRCTVVNLDRSNPSWYGPAALKARNFLDCQIVKAARDIFGEDNIRFYGGGIPNVFLDGDGKATNLKLEQLLDWDAPVSV